MVHAFNDTLYARMLEASKTHKSLAAAAEQTNLKAEINKELALLLQKKGKNPAPALTAAKIAELEQQTGLKISAAIERHNMHVGQYTSLRATVGNFNKGF